jgi:hypothetical protein
MPPVMRHLLTHFDTARFGGIDDWNLFSMRFPDTYFDGHWLGDGKLK